MAKNFFLGSIFFVFILLIFKNIFSFTWISGGDYINFSRENLIFFQNYPFTAWDSAINLGQNTIGILHYAPYNLLLAWIGKLSGYNNIIWERIVWWIPFLLLSFFSAYRLFKTFFPAIPFRFLSPVIFICNSYVLMMIDGGQIAGVGLAYAISPLVLLSFIKITNSQFNRLSIRSAIIAGLILAIQVMFDLRIAYITLIVVILYFVVMRKFSFIFIVPLSVAALLHAFWLIPAILFKVNTLNELGPAYNSIEAVKFLSFARLENTMALLHPNWPENIFGKIYFMRPEFLILPLLAYAALLFKTVEQSSRKIILFFALLGLIGAFLAKGASEPFGQIYLWLFEHVPGFIMFRDPTKWYLLVALSYSVLIPFSIFHMAKKRYYIFILVFAFYFLYLLHPALFNNLNGTFKTSSISPEYRQLNNFFSNEESFYRVLWIPARHEFGSLSQNHPAVYAQDFFKTTSTSAIVKRLKKEDAKNLVHQSAVKYIVLPFDSDRKNHKELVRTLKEIDWLKEKPGFGNIRVFELENAQDHFWSNAKNMRISYSYDIPTQYTVSVKDGRKGDLLIFSESFNPAWKALKDNSELSSLRYNKLFNSFRLPEDGSYELKIYYKQQDGVNLGLGVSLAGVIIIIVFLMLLSRFFNKAKNKLSA